MRASHWLLKRWRSLEPDVSLKEMIAASRLSKRTLMRLQSEGMRKYSTYYPRRDTIKQLAGPLRYGPAATRFLIDNAKDEFDAADLDALAGPLNPRSRERPPERASPGEDEGRRGATNTPAAGNPPEALATVKDVKSLETELRAELRRMQSILSMYTSAVADMSRAAHERLAKRPKPPLTHALDLTGVDHANG